MNALYFDGMIFSAGGSPYNTMHALAVTSKVKLKKNCNQHAMGGLLLEIIHPSLPWSSSRPPANHLTVYPLHQSSSLRAIYFLLPCLPSFYYT